jgi:phenylalanyl-tRNA synthetase beta chain
MRVSFEWLKEFVEIPVAPEEVAAKLTMIGLEVEGIEDVDGDKVLEVNVTPNRPDCLSILGIAREISAAYHIPLKIPQHELDSEQPVSDFSIEIVRPELCHRYTGRFMKDVKLSDSPSWIKNRLEKCGIRAINNIVDITNYVLLEFGHPLHAFDADKIHGKKIIVNTAGKSNKIVTLDGIERAVPEDALLIWDSTRPVAIAGVMGGLETEVSASTRNIFLESAYFAPFSVRKTSKEMNLFSESSYRFERGTDIVFLENALNRTAQMIREIAGGTIHEIVDAYPVKYVPEPVTVRGEKINKILGTEVPRGDMLEMLKKLGMSVQDEGDFFYVFPPTYRRDIQRENDIAEEVARFFGYDRIHSMIPKSPLSCGLLNERTKYIDRIREVMRKSGFTEIITYSFMSPSSLGMIHIPQTDGRWHTIGIRNPLRQEESLLRTTLIPALLDRFRYNLDRGQKDIRFFELARVFQDTGEILPLEELMLGGLYYRERVPSLWGEDVKGFFVTKGLLESMCAEFKIQEFSFYPSSEPFLHQGQSADIYVSGSRLGSVGVIDPEIAENLDLKRHNPEIVLFEINLDLFYTFISEPIQYVPIPKYPAVERDIAVVVDEALPASEIQNMIETFASELIETVSIFDVYRGEHIPEGKKSIAFNIVYRSQQRTLRDDEVERVHTELVDSVLQRTGGELRG